MSIRAIQGKSSLINVNDSLKLFVGNNKLSIGVASKPKLSKGLFPLVKPEVQVLVSSPFCSPFLHIGGVATANLNSTGQTLSSCSGILGLGVLYGASMEPLLVELISED